MRKYTFIICLLIVFYLLFPTVFGNMFSTDNFEYNKDSSSTLSYWYYFERPSVELNDDSNQNSYVITLADLPVEHKIYDFSFPVKPLRILLPYGTSFDTVSITTSDAIILSYNFTLFNDSLLPHTTTQSTSEVSDSSVCTYEGTHVCRGYPIVYLNLHPVSYNKQGNLIYYEWIQIDINTKKSTNNPQIRNRNDDSIFISSLINNPHILETYESFNSNIKTKNEEDTSYIIITNNALANSGFEDNLQYLAYTKNERGVSTEIYTVETILENEEYSVNGTWGDNNPSNPFYQQPITENFSRFDDTAARIRNFIRYAYMELGTEYVLLAGDADIDNPHENIIPARGLFANESGLPLISKGASHAEEEDDIPSDIYYACLDGNFNADMDGHFGESADRNNISFEEEADLLSEVVVGRAPVDSAEEVAYFVSKTILYEQQEDHPYLSKILFSGEYLGFPGISQFGGNYKDIIIPYVPSEYTLDFLYDRDWPLFDPDAPWNGGWDSHDILTILNHATPHLINHDGHSYYAYNMRMSKQDILSLENNHPFFLYSHGCMAGGFDNPLGYDCIAETMTVETPHGAFAAIMNARYGLGSENNLESPSLALDESFYKALFTENIREIGKANHYAKEDHIWHINDNGIRWVYYETNLFGDPELAIRDASSTSVDVSIDIHQPSPGFLYMFQKKIPLFLIQSSVILGEFTAEVSVHSQPMNQVSGVHFFIDGVDAYFDSAPPFEWKLPPDLKGSNTLRIVAYATDGKTITESIPLYIWN